jgi:pimeloyl-ACP methyl ester carboxylesterase
MEKSRRFSWLVAHSADLFLDKRSEATIISAVRMRVTHHGRKENFQVAEYAKHFTCFSLDLRGTGESDKPAGAYSSRVSRTQRRDRRDNLRNSLRAPRALR